MPKIELSDEQLAEVHDLVASAIERIEELKAPFDPAEPVDPNEADDILDAHRYVLLCEVLKELEVK